MTLAAKTMGLTIALTITGMHALDGFGCCVLQRARVEYGVAMWQTWVSHECTAGTSLASSIQVAKSYDKILSSMIIGVFAFNCNATDGVHRHIVSSHGIAAYNTASTINLSCS